MTQTMQPPPGEAPPRSPAGALAAAVGHLRGRQDPAGWWKGELATNVTMDAEDLLMREFLGIRTAAETEEAARWIRSSRAPTAAGRPSTAAPASCPPPSRRGWRCGLAGDPPDAAHLRRAQEFILAGGGLEKTRVFTRVWLALFGLWPWDRLPDLPPEADLLPVLVPAQHLQLRLLGPADRRCR